MIRCFAGMLMLFLLVGCAKQADLERASGPAPLADTRPTEVAPTDAIQTETVQTETAGTETAEKKTAETEAVKTETIVMKVPGMT